MAASGTIRYAVLGTLVAAGVATVAVTAQGLPQLRAGDAGLLSLRPERIELHRETEAAVGQNSLTGKIVDTVYQGDHLRVVIETEVGRIIARISRKAHEWPTGAKVTLSFGASDAWVIAP